MRLRVHLVWQRWDRGTNGRHAGRLLQEAALDAAFNAASCLSLPGDATLTPGSDDVDPVRMKLHSTSPKCAISASWTRIASRSAAVTARVASSSVHLLLTCSVRKMRATTQKCSQLFWIFKLLPLLLLLHLFNDLFPGPLG